MNYEIVTLKEKTLLGLSARTGNDDPNMGEIIGGLWKKLFTEGVYESIKNKSNDYSIGLYSDYSDNTYSITVGAEVSENNNPELIKKTIPAGKYAVFSIEGNMVTAVAQSWNEIWQTDLDRSYAGDFEEYLNSDPENAKIKIYIALK